MLGSHLFTLTVFSVLVSTFFACLGRETLKEGLKIASIMAGSMVGVSLVIAYIMYIFPWR
jgi:hypothetical protein